jgi:hypothetical protein
MLVGLSAFAVVVLFSTALCVAGDEHAPAPESGRRCCSGPSLPQTAAIRRGCGGPRAQREPLKGDQAGRLFFEPALVALGAPDLGLCPADALAGLWRAHRQFKVTARRIEYRTRDTKKRTHPLSPFFIAPNLPTVCAHVEWGL